MTEKIEKIGEISAPYGKQVSFQQIAYGNGFQMLRVRIREGKRFTDLDLDANTVQQWQNVFAEWLTLQKEMEAENVLE